MNAAVNASGVESGGGGVVLVVVTVSTQPAREPTSSLPSSTMYRRQAPFGARPFLSAPLSMRNFTSAGPPSKAA